MYDPARLICGVLVSGVGLAVLAYLAYRLFSPA